MIIEVDKERISDVTVIYYDTNSLQFWGKEDGKMFLNIIASDIKRIIVETNE